MCPYGGISKLASSRGAGLRFAMSASDRTTKRFGCANVENQYSSLGVFQPLEIRLMADANVPAGRTVRSRIRILRSKDEPHPAKTCPVTITTTGRQAQGSPWLKANRHAHLNTVCVIQDRV